jgi:predicted molibdopterin-dependent oxidoreductase YjgC
MAVIWSMGITQHTTGVSNVLSLANLQMLLGNMGVPGGGVNPLRGQNNVQGACDLGALPNVFPGYQRVDDASACAKFSAAWKLSGSDPLAQTPGLTVTEMIESVRQGSVRALYILGEDPAMTEPDSNHARECMARAELIVLQEIFDSETAAYADVLLPGASFAEKCGTFTNTERRVQPVRQAIDPLGDAMADWQITSQLATLVLDENEQAPIGDFAGWSYDSPADVLQEINALTPSYAGITPARVQRGDRLQWPVLNETHSGTPILHVEQFARGLGKFHAVDYLPAAELPDADYPLLLTTGRVLYHWHGGELTRRAKGLATVCPEPVVELSPDDAMRHGVEDGQWVALASRRGELEARACITTRVSEGVIFANFHFPGTGNANNLTINAVDPIAKIPEYKVCAVRVSAAEPFNHGG